MAEFRVQFVEPRQRHVDGDAGLGRVSPDISKSGRTNESRLVRDAKIRDCDGGDVGLGRDFVLRVDCPHAVVWELE